MPLDIDPGWEYWEPDPEVAEVLAEASVASPVDRLMGDATYDEVRGCRQGITFGWGDPSRTRVWSEDDRGPDPAAEFLKAPLAFRRAARRAQWAAEAARLEEVRAEARKLQGRRRGRMHDAGLFKRLWLSGVPTRQIMEVFGFSWYPTLRRWRVKLGLPPRPRGGIRRAKVTP